MTDSRDHLPGDLQMLRYLDALNAGDLEAVAGLWEEASRDPELERILAELDGALFAEHHTARATTAARRGSELALNRLPAMRSRWAVWVGAVGAMAAACVLVVFAWSKRDHEAEQANSARANSAEQVTQRAPPDLVGAPAWPEDQRAVDGVETSTFHWPLPEMAPVSRSTSIPADLLN
jgi:hypothetical protein